MTNYNFTVSYNPLSSFSTGSALETVDADDIVMVTSEGKVVG
jgi:hypothetical protein